MRKIEKQGEYATALETTHWSLNKTGNKTHTEVRWMETLTLWAKDMKPIGTELPRSSKRKGFRDKRLVT